MNEEHKILKLRTLVTDGINSLSLDSLTNIPKSQGSVSRPNSPSVAEFSVSVGALLIPEHVEYISSDNTAPLTRKQKLEILAQLGFADTLKNMVELSRNTDLDHTIQVLLRDKGKQPIFSRFTRGNSRPSSLKLMPNQNIDILQANLQILKNRGFLDDEILICALSQQNNAVKAEELLTKLKYNKTNSTCDLAETDSLNSEALQAHHQSLLLELGFSIPRLN
jgi:hypothetical protein